jgi:glutamate-1-semialdehyde 2,1-aminomutase
MVAAIETIRELKEKDGVSRMWKVGERLIRGLRGIGEEQGVELEVVGVPPMPMLKFTVPDEARREALKKSFFAGMAAGGILLHPGHCWMLSTAHSEKDVDKTLDVARESLKKAKAAGK